MSEFDVRKSLEIIRFADGGRNENNVYIQDYDGFQLAVVRDSDGKEAEIEAKDIGNLIKALEQVKEYFEDGRYIQAVSVSGNTSGYTKIPPVKFRTGYSWYQDGWIRHDGGECPVHPMDMVEYRLRCLPVSTNFGLAKDLDWDLDGVAGDITHYRPIRDEDGVPYCSADGLENWAEYVATDEDGDVNQYSGVPTAIVEYTMWWPNPDDKIEKAPRRYSNTSQHWTETLRRVYRDPADEKNYRMGA